MSGSSSANGSCPTSSRAHHTAWPKPSGTCWRVKLAVPGPGRSLRQRVEIGPPLPLGQRQLELELAVEMVLDDALVAPGDEDEMLDAGLARLVDHVLDQRPVDDRQHLLGHGLGGGQEPGAEAGDGEHGFANWFHGLARIVVGMEACAVSVLPKFQCVTSARPRPAVEGLANCRRRPQAVLVQ